MALVATAIWEVRSGGNDNNGGAFNPARGGADYTLQNAPQLALTDLACASNTTLTSAAGGFTAAMVGNHVCIASGTNALAGWYEITAYTNTNTVTIDRTCATGGNMSSGVGNVGGCLATPGQLGAALTASGVTGQKAHIKADTYTITTATPGPAGPYLMDANISVEVSGYQTTRGDKAARPVLHAGAITGVTLWASRSAFISETWFCCLEADGNGNATVNGFGGGWGGRRPLPRLCLARNCVIGFATNASECSAISCTTGFSLITNHCTAYSCTTGFANAPHTHSVAVGGTSGFAVAHEQNFIGCAAIGTSGDGFNSARSCRYDSCLVVRCGGYAFRSSATLPAAMFRCAAFDSFSGHTIGLFFGEAIASLSANPFVDDLGGDYRLNNDVGGGAVLRAAGISVFGQTDNRDIGAVQHSDPTQPRIYVGGRLRT